MPQTPAEFAFAFTVILLAGYVRGYGGFGFSMITVVGLTLLFPPAVVVPVVLLLEVLASAFLIAGVWHKINWPALLWLSIGVLVGTPAGVWLLGFLPEHLLKICIAIIIGVLALPKVIDFLGQVATVHAWGNVANLKRAEADWALSLAHRRPPEC